MPDPAHHPLPLDRASLQRLVHDFYADVRRDPALGPVFDAAIGPRWDAHLARMVEFWSTVMLHTRSFKGNVYAKHVALADTTKIDPAHFLRWITLWHRHTSALFEPQVARELQQTAHGIGRNLFHGFFQQFARFEMKDGEAVGWVAA
jgi:hemoglobin